MIIYFDVMMLYSNIFFLIVYKEFYILFGIFFCGFGLWEILDFLNFFFGKFVKMGFCWYELGCLIVKFLVVCINI